MRAEENYRERRALHNHAKRFHTVHARHFEVERDYIRLEFFYLFQREGAIHGRSDDFDGRVPGQDRRNQLPHESGIVDDQNADALV
jgi:hypothetical protein